MTWNDRFSALAAQQSSGADLGMDDAQLCGPDVQVQSQPESVAASQKQNLFGTKENDVARFHVTHE